MQFRLLRILSWTVILALVLSACGSHGDVAQLPAVDASHGPVELTGSFQITNDFVFTYYVENAVALLDMHGFVIRDETWELPADSQVLGRMTYDSASKSGTFDLSLPALPRGEFNDVDHNGNKDMGVQVFAVGYSPNLYGGPFAEGDDRSRGWPAYLASVKTDSENNDEVIGGKLIVWAPDANQQFPSGFGADGLLFTDDDPVAAIPAGYSIVDLDQNPFKLTQTSKPELALYEPADVALKDFSSLSYTEAFDKMFEIVRKEYAFNGVEGKQPDWDALYAELGPRVQQAQKDKDPNAFYLALRDFTWAFKDGHISLDGGQYEATDFNGVVAGGYGFAIRELDDGRVVVIYVMDGGPAAQAGMQVGARVTAFNGQPIADAISSATSYALQSSDFTVRYQKARYLLRAKPGTQAEVTFTNPNGSEQTVKLTAIEERDSFSRTSVYFGVETDPLLPVDSQLITQGNAQVGYIRVNSNGDDLNLIIRLFERALKEFEARKVAGLIIDMRTNNGGAPLGLAGFLTDKEIPLGQLEYYSEAMGKFEPEGVREKVYPNTNQYHFDKLVLLVGQACYSACEIEAYGFSQVPGMLTVGQYPTAGVEAEVARGQFALPEGFSLQIPTGRFTLPDGSIFLEGKGVVPSLRVPVDESTVYSTDDLVLQAGLDSILKPLGQGQTPSGAPKVATADEALSALSGGASFLEGAARETHAVDEYKQPGTLKFTIPLNQPQTLVWAYAWCAKDAATLEQNWANLSLQFVLDGKEIPIEQFAVFNTDANGKSCRMLYTALSDWPAGEHHLSTTATFTSALNDGTADFAAGDYILDYTVYVGP
ncbi:MAG: PDZ domain-containing protein [Chloroflexi bacterium]|nr:PDZ domain-containing protein [Chloroflexota bacterium]